MLNLTNDEKQILINALNISVMQGGLNAAQVALPLAQKLQQSMQPVLVPDEGKQAA